MCGFRPEQQILRGTDRPPLLIRDGGFFVPAIPGGNPKTNPPMTATLAIRVPTENPDHHLWNNHGTWWCHYTEHLSDHTKRRVRRSLGTADRVTARFLRDSLFHENARTRHEVSPAKP
jgi:hypothetical protein